MLKGKIFLSVIIPVYNREILIERCLRSLIASINRLKPDQRILEILIVDDGSKDNSLQVCKKFAAEYEWVKVFCQSNEGAGAARNHGLNRSTSQFITFVDSDDTVEIDYFQKIFCNLSSDIDILAFGMNRISNGSATSRPLVPRRIDSNGCRKLLQNVSEFKEIFWYPWNKVYSSALVESLRFPTDLVLGEDTVFNLNAFSAAKQVVVIEDCLYNYEYNQDSLSQKKFSPDFMRSMERHFEERVSIHLNNGDFDLPAVKKDISLYYIDHILPRLISNFQQDGQTKFIDGIKKLRKLPMFEFCTTNYPFNRSSYRKFIRAMLFKHRFFRPLSWINRKT